MELQALIVRACKRAVDSGFWEGLDPLDVNIRLAKLALLTSEIGEAVEAVRKNDQENLGEELADIAIRLFDLGPALGFDLEAEILKKMDKNDLRPYKHGKLA